MAEPTETTAAEPLVLTVAEVAQLLRLDPRTVRDLFKRGELAGNQAGHAIRLYRASVLDWISGKCPTRARRRTA